MRLIRIVDSSNIVKFYRKVSLGFRLSKEYFSKICRDSNIFYTFRKLLQKTNIYFKFSFFWWISEVKTKETTEVLNKSFVLRFLNEKFSMFKNRISGYFSENIILKSVREFNGMLYSAPIKTISPIIVLLILLNVVLTIFLKREINLLGWVFRLCFLIIGLIGLTCNADWLDLKKTSFVLRKLDEKN